MSKIGQYISPRSGNILTLYSQPERNKEYIEFQWTAPVQAGPILANWEAPILGEWNELQYLGKSYFVYENFDLVYESSRTPGVRHILTKVPLWSRKDNDWEDTTTGEKVAGSLGLGDAYNKLVGSWSTLKWVTFIVGGLVIYKSLSGITPKRRASKRK